MCLSVVSTSRILLKRKVCVVCVCVCHCLCCVCVVCCGYHCTICVTSHSVPYTTRMVHSRCPSHCTVSIAA